jgi:hypothetical protein
VAVCKNNAIPQRLITDKKRVLIMSEEEKEIEEMAKRHRFRPPMDDADSPSHDSHIKKLQEQEKT